ncbi:hypothetical protein D3C78_1901900 [compost metagenome]
MAGVEQRRVIPLLPPAFCAVLQRMGEHQTFQAGDAIPLGLLALHGVHAQQVAHTVEPQGAGQPVMVEQQ